MSTELSFEPDTFSAEAATFVEEFATEAQSVIDSWAETRGFVGPHRLSIVVTDQFQAEVRQRMQGARGAGSYTVDRVGGTVAGKNLPHPSDPDAGVIVLDNTMLNDLGDPGSQLLGAFVVAHELMHPPLDWTRAASGSADAEPPQAITPPEVLRAMLRTCIDEFRADLHASAILRKVTHSGPLSETAIERLEWFLAEQHKDTLMSALGSFVDPGWLSAVEEYRGGAAPLEDLWGRLVMELDQVLSLMGHAEAMAFMARQPAVLKVESSQPAVVQQLATAWTEISQFMLDHVSVPHVNAFAAIEEQFLEVGSGALQEVWASLGLTFTEFPEQSFYIHVAEAT